MLKTNFGKKLISICCALAMLIPTMALATETVAEITTTPADGTTEIGSETTVTVSTNEVEIDFVGLEALGSDAVTVSGGTANVGSLVYDDLEDPYSYSFAMTGLEKQTTYKITVKVPLMTSDVAAEKTFSITTVPNYRVLVSAEYEGYRHETGPTSNDFPLVDFNRQEVWWNQNVNHVLLDYGFLSLDASVNGDGSFGQPGTVTDLSRGLYTKDVKSIQMRARVSKATQIKMYYASNEQDWFSEGDACGNYTLVSDTTIPADGAWHIVNFTPTSAAWVNNTTKILHQCWFGTIEQVGEFDIDWIRFMGDGAIPMGTHDGVTSELKYGFEGPEVTRDGNTCTATVPSFVNYSSSNINLSLFAASYDEGKLTDVKFTSASVAAGKTLPAMEVVLTDVGEDEEVKAFFWKKETLIPMNPGELYDIYLPDETNSEGGNDDDEEIVLEPEDTDFEGKTKVLILGNSYTHHAPGKIFTNGVYVNWKGDWGMAASSQANDFAHLLKSYAKAKNENVAFMIKNIYNYESNPADYANQKNALSDAAALDADVIILAIGTNMSKDLDYVDDAYGALIEYLDADNDANVICAMLLGTGDVPRNSMFNVANEKGAAWVELTDKNGGEYLAYQIYGENGVGWHYGDNGMKMVADYIWNGREYISDYVQTNSNVTVDTANVSFTGLKDLIPEPVVQCMAE